MGNKVGQGQTRQELLGSIKEFGHNAKGSREPDLKQRGDVEGSLNRAGRVRVRVPKTGAPKD